MTLRTFILATVAAVISGSGHAMTLEFTGSAIQSAEQVEPYGSYAFPLGPWSDGVIASENAEGKITQQAWKVSAQGLTTLQLLAPLREQLSAAGFEIVFECESTVCGGFDFRFDIDVVPEPAMHVDLGDYRFLSARRLNGETPQYLSLLVSRSGDTGFVQFMHVGAENAAAPQFVASTEISEPLAVGRTHSALGEILEQEGYVVLEDLNFETGSSELDEGDYVTLVALAEYLNAHRDKTIALVGHTDAEGSLAGNVALSKRRASSVLQHLVSNYGVDSAQMSAEGMGFLSPRATNLTEDGRTQNRRVEVILTSIE